MTRLPVVAFAVLVVATIGAFFVSQHLKISNPLINGDPRADPPAINPVAGRVCTDLAGRRVSFRKTRVNFYLQARSDTAGVYIVQASGKIVDTVTTGRYMRVNRRYTFTWDGRLTGGRPAPPGTYFFRVVLQSESRTVTLTGTPVRVITRPPHPRVISVSATAGAGTGTGAAAGAGTAAGAGASSSSTRTATPPRTSASSQPAIVASPRQSVVIRFVKGAYRSAFIEIYRTDLPGRPRVVKSFRVRGASGRAVWNGLIAGRPAPAGTYLIGMRVTDAACNAGTFPAVSPPSSAGPPQTGVTVRYLAAELPPAP